MLTGQTEGCRQGRWEDVDGTGGGMLVGGCSWGQMLMGQMEGCRQGRCGDTDGEDEGMLMGQDADGAFVASLCPPLRRGAGEGGAAAWLSAPPPFGKQSQAPVFPL